MEGKGSNASPKLTEEKERKKDCNKWHNYINVFFFIINYLFHFTLLSL